MRSPLAVAVNALADLILDAKPEHRMTACVVIVGALAAGVILWTT